MTITEKETARVRTHAGVGSDATGNQRLYKDTPPQAGRQAPDGQLPAYFKDGMIWVGGKHLCTVRDGDLRRTFDATRELWRGGLAFRIDVLRLAVTHGARRIVATERGSGVQYVIDLKTFRAQGDPLEHPRFGEQWTCELRHWRREGEPVAGAVQRGLWA